jgi:hypothetical protein
LSDIITIDLNYIFVFKSIFSTQPFENPLLEKVEQNPLLEKVGQNGGPFGMGL